MRRIDHTKTRTAKPWVSSSMVPENLNGRDIMKLHRVLGHPSREITRETACMAGKHRLHEPQHAGVEGYIPAMGKLQTIPQNLEGGIIGNDLCGDEPVGSSVRAERVGE